MPSPYFKNTHGFSDLTGMRKHSDPLKKAKFVSIGAVPVSLTVGMGGNYKMIPFGHGLISKM